MNTCKGSSAPADSSEEDVLVLEVDPIGLMHGNRQMELVVTALAAGRTVVLQPRIQTRDKSHPPPPVLRTILALGFGVISATASFFFVQDSWLVLGGAFVVGTTVGAIVAKRDAIRHPEGYPI